MDLEVMIAYLMMSIVVFTTYIASRFFQSKSRISANWLASAVFVVGLWTSLQGLAIVLIDINSTYTIFLLYISRTLGAICAVCIICFTLEYSTGEAVSYTVLSLIVLPVIVIHSLFAMAPSQFMVITVLDGAITYDFKLLGIAHIIYVGMLYIMSVGLMVREVLVSDGIKFSQARILLIGLVFGISFSFIPVLDIPDAMNPTIIGLLIMVSSFTYGLNKYNLFTTTPVSSNQILDGVSGGVLVLNADEEIIQLNNEVYTLFGHSSISLGDSINQTFSKEIQTALLSEGMSVVDYYDSTLQVNTKNSPQIASDTGFIISIDDISEVEKQQTELTLLRQVYSRIFRHNIRNRLTVIRGHTKYLESEEESTDTGFHTDTILSACDDLITKSEKALLINSILQSDSQLHTISVSEFINRGLEQVEVPQETTVNPSISIQKNCEIQTHAQGHYILSNAIENAYIHNQCPNVSISVSNLQGEKVLIDIEDDGCGIPIDEIDVIESGVESQLEHSTGVGLWVMQIISSKSDADLSMTTSESGTSIQIEFNIAD